MIAAYIVSSNRAFQSSVKTALDDGYRCIPCNSVADLQDMVSVREEDAAEPILTVFDVDSEETAGDYRSVAANMPNEAVYLWIAEPEYFALIQGIMADEDLSGDLVSRAPSEAEFHLRLRNLGRLATCRMEHGRLERHVRRLTGRVEDASAPELHDSATGLFNRYGLERFHETEWRRCMRYDWPLSVIAVQMDGQAFLDAANVQRSAAALQESLRRPGDAAGRYDQEGLFVAVLSETPEAGARHVAGRIQAAVRDAGRTTVSAGVVTEIPKEFYRRMGRSRAQKQGFPGEALVTAAIRGVRDSRTGPESIVVIGED